MILLDPFYGVSDKGKTIARWLNRILIIYELYVIGTLMYLYHQTFPDLPFWIYIVMPIVGFVLMGVANLIVRGFWNIVLTFIYGTTDAEEIIENIQLRQAKREMRRKRREDMRANK